MIEAHEKCSYYVKAIDHIFLWFISAINYWGCWNNTQKACNPTISSHVLGTTLTMAFLIFL